MKEIFNGLTVPLLRTQNCLLVVCLVTLPHSISHLTGSWNHIETAVESQAVTDRSVGKRFDSTSWQNLEYQLTGSKIDGVITLVVEWCIESTEDHMQPEAFQTWARNDILRNETKRRQGISHDTIAHRSGGKTLLFTTTTPRSTTPVHNLN